MLFQHLIPLSQFLDHHIERYDDPETDLGVLDVETASDNVFRELLSSFGSDGKVIEDQSYINIGGHSGQTFLISVLGNGIKVAHQNWQVFVGDHSYQIINLEQASDFDSPENTEIRNHFIDSIKFPGYTEPQKSRFE